MYSSKFSKKINILDVYIDNFSQEELCQIISEKIKSDCKIKIFTPNTEILLKTERKDNEKYLINSAEILIPDGKGLILASKILKTPLKERIAGIDLAEDIMKIALKNNYSIYILGGKDNIAKQAKINLKLKYKALKICGTHSGYFSQEESNDIINKITSAKADILFVCMGFPRQERWIYENIDKLTNVKLAIGLGGSVDVWAGKLKRAPYLFRKCSVEWLWRMLLEPRRFKFLFDIPVFLSKILIQRYKTIKKAKITDGKND